MHDKTSTAARDWHLKVKDTESDAGITKYYCLTVNMLKISSVHKLTLKVQQILEFHELNGYILQESLKQLLEFLNLHQHLFHQLILEIQTVFRVPWPDSLHPFLTMFTEKIFDQLLIYATLHQHAKNQATSLIWSGDTID